MPFCLYYKIISNVNPFCGRQLTHSLFVDEVFSVTAFPVLFIFIINTIYFIILLLLLSAIVVGITGHTQNPLSSHFIPINIA